MNTLAHTHPPPQGEWWAPKSKILSAQAAHLEVEADGGASHQVVEVLVKVFAQDVLRQDLVGIERLFLQTHKRCVIMRRRGRNLRLNQTSEAETEPEIYVSEKIKAFLLLKVLIHNKCFT